MVARAIRSVELKASPAKVVFSRRQYRKPLTSHCIPTPTSASSWGPEPVTGLPGHPELREAIDLYVLSVLPLSPTLNGKKKKEKLHANGVKQINHAE